MHCLHLQLPYWQFLIRNQFAKLNPPPNFPATVVQVALFIQKYAWNIRRVTYTADAKKGGITVDLYPRMRSSDRCVLWRWGEAATRLLLCLNMPKNSRIAVKEGRWVCVISGVTNVRVKSSNHTNLRMTDLKCRCDLYSGNTVYGTCQQYNKCIYAQAGLWVYNTYHHL